MSGKTDIVLINPLLPSVEKSWYLGIQGSITDMVPLGLLYIATMLYKDGYNVKVYDFNILRSEEEITKCLEEIASSQPRIVGVSVMTESYFRAASLTKLLRNKLDNKSIFVWGGYHVTFLPEAGLMDGLADIVVRGEGELPMLEIARLFLNENNFNHIEEIEGVSYYSGGKIYHNRPAFIRVKNINSLPIPDRTLLKIDRYRNPGTLVSSRGCVAKCQFCAAGAMGNITLREAQNVVEEIEIMHKLFHPKYLFFVDNTFTTNKNRVYEIFNLLKKKKIDLYSKIESRVTQVDEEYVKFLANSNVFLIQFGIETGNKDIMKDINKRITLEHAEYAVELCLRNLIQVTTYFIIGHPNETRETVSDTFDFAKKMRRLGARVELGILTPFPGTQVFINRKELCVEIVDWNFEHWNLSTPVIRTKSLSNKDLRNLYRDGLNMLNSIN